MADIFTGIPDDELFLNPLEDVERSRRMLPHWYQPGKLQFVTFRLGDSLPAKVRGYYQSRMDAFRQFHPEPWSAETRHLFAKTFYPTLQKMLDSGYGECLLRDERVRKVVVDAFDYREGKDFELGDIVVMPNHVHFLAAFNREPKIVMERLMDFTTREINRLLGRRGGLWDRDFFDRMIRNERHLENVRGYIADNPRGLGEGEYYLRRF